MRYENRDLGDDVEVVQLSEDELGTMIDRRVEQRLKRERPRLVSALGNPATGLSDDGASRFAELSRKVSRRYAGKLPEDEFSFVRLALARAEGDWNLAPFERDAIEMTRKNLEWASGSGGGLWVADEFIGSEFIDALRSKVVVIKAGATEWTASGGIVQVPRLGGSTTAYWVSQGEEIPESDVTPDQVTFTPHILVGRSTISQLQAYMNPGLAERVVREDLEAQLVRALDIAALRGTGSADEPEGIANVSGINTFSLSTGSGDVPSLDDFYDMELTLREDEVDGDLGWIMSPREWNTIRKIKDTDGRPIVVPDPTQAGRGFLLGHPIYTTTHCRTTLGGGSLGEFFLGRWPELVIVRWGALRIQTTVEGSDHYERDELGVKAVMWCDIGVKHPVSFCYCADAAAS